MLSTITTASLYHHHHYHAYCHRCLWLGRPLEPLGCVLLYLLTPLQPHSCALLSVTSHISPPACIKYVCVHGPSHLPPRNLVILSRCRVVTAAVGCCADWRKPLRNSYMCWRAAMVPPHLNQLLCCHAEAAQEDTVCACLLLARCNVCMLGSASA
jgi:hypothetical protein